MKLKHVFYTTSAAAIALAALSCAPESITGGATTNQGMPTIFMSGGTPARYATVSLFESNSNTMIPVDKITTDENGQFDPQKLAIPAKTGYYNIQIESDTEAVLIDSVLLADSNRKALISDTLAPTGSITGVVKIQKNHDVSAVVVHALGTNKFSNVNSKGEFALNGLGKGEYNLEFSVASDVGIYGKLFKDTVVSASTKTIYADTIELPYFDIPVVSGVKAVYDTSNGVAQISWDSVSYSQFRSYFVYRTDDYLNWPTTPIATVNGTTYRDTECSYNKKNWYRVAVQNKSGVAGLTFDEDSIFATNPQLVHTSITSTITHLGTGAILGMQIESDSSDWSGVSKTAFQVSKNDSVQIAITASNPTRKIGSIFIGEEKNGVSDTVRAVSMLIAKDTTLVIGVIDNAGEIRKDTITFRVVEDAPKFVSIDSMATLNVQDTIRVQFEKKYGRIVSYRWKIGTTFDTVTTTPELPLLLTTFGITEASVTAVDDDGASTTQAFTVMSQFAWEQIGKAPIDLSYIYGIESYNNSGVMGTVISNNGTTSVWLSEDGVSWREIVANIAKPDSIENTTNTQQSSSNCISVDGAIYLRTTWANGDSSSRSITIDKSTDGGSTWERCLETNTKWRIGPEFTEFTSFSGVLYLRFIKENKNNSDSYMAESIISSDGGKNWSKSPIELYKGYREYRSAYTNIGNRLVQTQFTYDQYSANPSDMVEITHQFWNADGSYSEQKSTVPYRDLGGEYLAGYQNKIIQTNGKNNIAYYDESTQKFHRIGSPIDTVQSRLISNQNGLFQITSDGTIYRTK